MNLPLPKQVPLTPLNAYTISSWVFPQSKDPEPLRIDEFIEALAQLSEQEANKDDMSSILHQILIDDAGGRSSSRRHLTHDEKFELVDRILTVRPEWVNCRHAGYMAKGITPLITAVSQDNVKPEIVSLLLARGANPRLADDNNFNALDHVARKTFPTKDERTDTDQTVVIRSLLATQLMTQDNLNRALHQATGHRTVYAFKILMDHGAEPSISEGLSTLARASFKLAYYGHTVSDDIFDVLLAHPSASQHINYGWNLGGETAVSRAICSRNTDTLRALIQAGAWVNPPDPDLCEKTPLMLAVIELDMECIHLLIQAGADATLVDPKYHRNAIHWLSEQHSGSDKFEEKFEGCIRALIQAGCDPCAQDINSETASDLAKRRGLASMVEFLQPFENASTLLSTTEDARGQSRRPRI